MTDKGICSVRLGETKQALERELKKEFSAAQLVESDKNLKQWVQALIDYLAGHKPWPLLPYDVKATAFQRRVWGWLRTIPLPRGHLPIYTILLYIARAAATAVP